MQRNRWPLIVAVILGLLVAGTATYYLFENASNYQQMTQIVVPKANIPAYTQLTADRLGIKTAPVSAVDNTIASDPSQVLGKVAVSDLFAGEQIRLERLTDQKLADTSRRQVAVNTNVTRSVGGLVAPGDLADVYWLQGEQVPGALLATDAVVLAVLDSEGNNLSGTKNKIIGEVQQKGLPQVVVLAVKPEFVPQLLRGSADESKGLVLVKKLKEGGTVAPTDEGREIMAQDADRQENTVRSD